MTLRTIGRRVLFQESNTYRKGTIPATTSSGGVLDDLVALVHYLGFRCRSESVASSLTQCVWQGMRVTAASGMAITVPR